MIKIIIKKKLGCVIFQTLKILIYFRTSSMSVGAYFQNRCTGFENIFPKTDSPKRDYSVGPNLLEGI